MAAPCGTASAAARFALPPLPKVAALPLPAPAPLPVHLATVSVTAIIAVALAAIGARLGHCQSATIVAAAQRARVANVCSKRA